ncbi:PIG-L deacetylase family protein [Phytoactinopolyspora halotolerans]|uniref:GlcNAc-PI de-N-acetylase n=1 Tax=Phytoactinopolyspora halotolerans TaxID=1981512 RepID=A0A6L9S6K0_9ACTN|nr:PIG-L family deacetylase [Phytoactinopolyspora halotolerans]NEE00274.1 GlcNAc-PI de-N-acetylase [Phytoactinopolyspora halotolerans]
MIQQFSPETSDMSARSHRDPVRGRTVVVMHAHPDDEAIFTGATIRRLADRGARVVLITATLGDLGASFVPLAPGETIVQRRTAELERAAELLGVARLALLGRRDSGLPGAADNVHPAALAAAAPGQVAAEVASIIEREGAEAIVHDDAFGIYGHPDHVAVNRIGTLAAQMSGVTSYQTTVDRDYLHEARPHLVHAAARATALPYGIPADQVELSVTASGEELVAKRAAISAHHSQIRPGELDGAAFGDAYGHEWYLRTGAAAVLDELTESVPMVVAAPAQA